MGQSGPFNGKKNLPKVLRINPNPNEGGSGGPEWAFQRKKKIYQGFTYNPNPNAGANPNAGPNPNAGGRVVIRGVVFDF